MGTAVRRADEAVEHRDQLYREILYPHGNDCGTGGNVLTVWIGSSWEPGHVRLGHSHGIVDGCARTTADHVAGSHYAGGGILPYLLRLVMPVVTAVEDE